VVDFLNPSTSTRRQEKSANVFRDKMPLSEEEYRRIFRISTYRASKFYFILWAVRNLVDYNFNAGELTFIIRTIMMKRRFQVAFTCKQE
jgi:hypothetical protein